MTENRRFNSKWTSGIGKHGYTAVPNLLLRCRSELGINMAETYIIMVIESFRWTTNLPWPSLETISNMSGLTERSIRRYLAALEQKGFVRRALRPGKTSTYDASGLVIQLDLLASKHPTPGQNWHKTSDKYVPPTRTVMSPEEEKNKEDKLIRRVHGPVNHGVESVGALLKSNDFGKHEASNG